MVRDTILNLYDNGTTSGLEQDEEKQTGNNTATTACPNKKIHFYLSDKQVGYFDRKKYWHNVTVGANPKNLFSLFNHIVIVEGIDWNSIDEDSLNSLTTELLQHTDISCSVRLGNKFTTIRSIIGHAINQKFSSTLVKLIEECPQLIAEYPGPDDSVWGVVEGETLPADRALPLLPIVQLLSVSEEGAAPAITKLLEMVQSDLDNKLNTIFSDTVYRYLDSVTDDCDKLSTSYVELGEAYHLAGLHLYAAQAYIKATLLETAKGTITYDLGQSRCTPKLGDIKTAISVLLPVAVEQQPPAASVAGDDSVADDGSFAGDDSVAGDDLVAGDASVTGDDLVAPSANETHALLCKVRDAQPFLQLFRQTYFGFFNSGPSRQNLINGTKANEFLEKASQELSAGAGNTFNIGEGDSAEEKLCIIM